MASTVRSDAGGSVIGFAIVFVSFVFRSLIPAPTWVWLVVLAVGFLLSRPFEAVPASPAALGSRGPGRRVDDGDAFYLRLHRALVRAVNCRA
jgi:hypothetical protein